MNKLSEDLKNLAKDLEFFLKSKKGNITKNPVFVEKKSPLTPVEEHSKKPEDLEVLKDEQNFKPAADFGPFSLGRKR